MFYNILINKTLPNSEINHCAVPADEGLNDLAYANGWRILVPALKEKHIAPTIIKREAWEWNLYLYDLANSDLSNFIADTGDIGLLVDDARFSPYVEDVSDELDEEDQWMELDDPADTADEVVPFDYVETFHHLNQQ